MSGVKKCDGCGVIEKKGHTSDSEVIVWHNHIIRTAKKYGPKKVTDFIIKPASSHDDFDLCTSCWAEVIKSLVEVK